MNIFRIIASGKHGFREEFASAFLAYLLSPKMDHGLGHSFLSRLLGRVAATGDFREIQGLAGSMKSRLWESVLDPRGDDTTVELEFNCGSGFVDVVVKCGDWFVMIENKIVHASRTADQVQTQYAGFLSTLGKQGQFGNCHVLVLYLVPGIFNGEVWAVSPSFQEELDKVELREGDRKALISWQPAVGDDGAIPSIVDIVLEILRNEASGTVPPLGTEVRYTLLSLVDFALGEFQGFHYEGATAKKSSGPKVKVRDVLNMTGDLYVGVRYGRGGTACDAWRNPAFLDREVSVTEDPGLGWQYVPLKDFQKIARWALDPEANDLSGLEWAGTPFGPNTLYQIGRWGKTDGFFIGLKGGVEKLKNMTLDEICSRVIWQIGNKKKNSSWIPASEFAEILDRKGFNPDGMPLLTEV